MPGVNMISKNNVWAPSSFPLAGRLPRETLKVVENYEAQTSEEKRFRQMTNSDGRKQHSECCHSLHVSLFFDGTNNNDDNDSKKNHPSNIARLFHASLGGKKAERRGYFSYYMPGVGTAFPEIGELDYSAGGLKYASGGEDRINWALVQLVSALTFALTRNEILEPDAKRYVEAMSTWKAPLMIAMGKGNRRCAMDKLLKPLQDLTGRARPRVLGIKLYVYGFSRGAAQARTFVTWLSELFDTPPGAERPSQSLIGLPVSVEFLGVLDTVASVGIAHAAPFFAGHMDWADDTQLLPDAQRFPGLVKCCRHFVAAFEQRSCFPLDSIRNEDGQYPDNTYEVVYPGVHSDVGGGYPQNDQGKARGSTQELVSQIVLHDLYASAFAVGAPLQVPEEVLPKTLMPQKSWRILGLDTREEFDISSQVIERFNTWRKTLPGIPADEPTPDSPELYQPLRLNAPVEAVLADQLAWITGWRIGRYANDRDGTNDSYKHQPFFKQAVEATPHQASEQLKAYEQHRKDLADLRSRTPEAATNYPGPPIYEPQIDQTQLSQAAAEFKSDYLGRKREQTSWVGTLTDVVLRDAIYLLNSDDEAQDHATLRAAGERRSRQLFRDAHGTPSADPQMAQLVALFDDQIHDSRAWFMHDALDTRELWAGYFFYRMTYFGNDNSRALSPVVVAGRVLGIAMIAGATAYGIKRKGAVGGLGGLAVGIGGATIGYQVIDKARGVVVPFLPDAEKVLQPTTHIGQVAGELKQQIVQDDLRQRIEQTSAMLRAAGSLFEPGRGVA